MSAHDASERGGAALSVLIEEAGEVISRAGGEARRIEDLRDRMRDVRLQLLVVGEAKRGKSTLVNALLGRPLLPTGVTPLTSIATRLTSMPGGARSRERVVIRYRDGRVDEAPLDHLARYVTEAGNPANRLHVARVDVLVESELLVEYAVDVIDTPGTGSVFSHNTSEALASLEGLDAVVMVLTADPPVSAAEVELLREAHARATATFVVLNKADRLSEDELEAALAFASSTVADALGQPVVVRAVSARAGALDPAFRAFAETLRRYLGERARTDALQSVRNKLCAEVSRVLDVTRVSLRTLELADEQRSDAARQLQERAVRAEASATSVGDRTAGAVAGLRRELDERAAACSRAGRRRVVTQVERCFDSRAATQDVEALASEAAELTRQVIVEVVDHWRVETASWLERALEVVAAQATEDVAAQGVLAQHAVQSVLHLQLEPHQPEPLHVDASQFWFDFREPVRWDPPLQRTLGRWRTAARRRTSARTTAVSRAADLLERQVGRARAGLQRQLEDAGRQLARDLDRDLTAAVAVLRHAATSLATGGDRSNAPALKAQVDELEHLLERVRTTRGPV